MEKEENAPRSVSEFSEYRKQILVIGIVAIGASIFGYIQMSFFNTYIDYILNLTPLHIAIMVSLSAIAGLIFLLVWGVISDNTRTKLGRRRPYLLFGLISGTFMILFAFVQDYFSALILRVIFVEISINAYYAVQRSLIPDLIPIEHRGKANGINGNISMVGMIVAVAATLFAYDQFVHGGELSQEGHFFLYCIGGISLIICAIIGFIFLKEASIEDMPPKKKFLEDLRDTFKIKELKKNKEYFKMMLAQTVFFMGLLIIAPYIFIYIFALGMTLFEMLVVVLFMAPAVAFAMWFLGKLADKIGRKAIIPPVIILSSIGFWMIPFVATKDNIILPLTTIALILAVIGFSGIMIPVSAWQQDLLPEDKRGQFNGILNIIYTGISIPGALLGALIYVVFGLEWTFAFVPIFLIASIPFFLRIEETLTEELRLK